MPRSLHLLAIGDATKDVFVDIEEATLSCTLNTEACLLCLNYADKIPVSSVTQIRAAGNAANAAVGSSRLGHRSGLVTILGDDDDGHELQDALKAERVDERFVTFDKKRGTNYSTILNFKSERTLLAFHQPRTYRFPKNLPETEWVYYSSLGEHHVPYEKQLLAYLKKHMEVRFLFNPGTHQLRRGLTSLLPVIKRSDVLILNKEEAEHLLEDGARPVPALVMRLFHEGPKTVVITDGQRGSWAYDGHDMWKLPIFPCKALERTGAGDAYATGLVNALIDGKPIAEAMRAGNANSWSVVQEIGPQKGLLTASEMRRVLKKFEKIRPQKVNHAAS
ncbi:hypothetical protein A3E39_02875 [Candidatus Uhrbacteria bacterium RIFCSPHIGHO2_12_FULL_60_25]|uniref:Carbohydrate kinase PfkB domain-containing protein n=1 Tax=Candidatus Uhrbacteria bacterium RIFCSPHIGHO2_12_FULL_60_25 TaxID=1802399 RepID=A0A1F7UL38_9BACT|nr:MAG: hypothetical protein A3D73_01750 [Candidatus Uhrbacteria bacterium RIFCSPHIGHO2_02_FULL_60_44]OGL78417.1 MAG: hypothetical protein A3E39_02875 [Candidatus Uhrbacteria bacterium RIFCSPHIGHO2_12_FULL_60_25]